VRSLLWTSLGGISFEVRRSPATGTDAATAEQFKNTSREPWRAPVMMADFRPPIGSTRLSRTGSGTRQPAGLPTFPRPTTFWWPYIATLSTLPYIRLRTLLYTMVLYGTLRLHHLMRSCTPSQEDTSIRQDESSVERSPTGLRQQDNPNGAKAPMNAYSHASVVRSM
jgi:hypothetical protein